MSKSFSSSSALPVLVAGGGIGGIAAALALVRRGFSVKVLEQAPSSARSAPASSSARTPLPPSTRLASARSRAARAVYTDEMVMHDAIDEYCVGRIPTGAAFRQRFGNPYAVIHRADVHGSLLEGAQSTPRIEVATRPRCSASSRTKAASRCSMRRAVATAASR